MSEGERLDRINGIARAAYRKLERLLVQFNNRYPSDPQPLSDQTLADGALEHLREIVVITDLEACGE